MTTLPDGFHGAHRRDEIEALLGRHAIRKAVEEGRLVAFSRIVLVDRRRLLDLPTRAAAALLHAGPRAVLTSHTAALLYGCSAADPGSIHVMVGYDQHLPSRPGLTVHYGQYQESDVVELSELRVLGLDAVIAQLLCTTSRSTALACADQALGSVAPHLRGELRAEIDHQLTVRADPRGRRRGRFLLDLATGLPESPWESRLLLKVVDEGFPVPTPQHEVRDLNGRTLYRLDFAWPAVRIALEYDGYAAHAGRQERDRARDADLGRRGWTVIRVTHEDLRNPTWLFERLRMAFAGQWGVVAA
ncbi:endonuclease domain-containing protein [Goodfellowiella coeruleoviolacea]|nr:DUF559 domain-containing protein [Goodfellowiella coeruleoviolacea]